MNEECNKKYQKKLFYKRTHDLITFNMKKKEIFRLQRMF